MVDSSPTSERAKRIEKLCVSRRIRSIRMSATSMVFLLDRDAGELVGKVFAVGKRLRLGVRSLVGNRIDGGAANALQPDRVGMDRDEQVGLVLPGDLHAVVEAQELVLLARHEHVVAAVGAQLVAQFRRQRSA